MQKTKSVGTRVDPVLNQEIERLKEAFAFNSFGDMFEVMVGLLQAIDEVISSIDQHPREWSPADLLSYLPARYRNRQEREFFLLVLKRIRQRFGADGVERIEALLNAEQKEKGDIHG